MRHSLNVEPLVETIRSDASTDLKRGAIEMLAKMRSPYAVSLLKECISDQNSEVRFYASSGLSRIEESLNEKIIKYKNIIKQKSEVTHQDYFLLAKAYYEFIYLSIQDEASLQYYLRQSVDNFEKAFQLNPQDINYIEELVRAYTRIGRHEDARQLKDKVHLKEHKNLMYLAESYYKEKDYRKCKEILETFAAQGLPQESSGPIAGVLSLWEIDSKTAQGGAQSYEA